VLTGVLDRLARVGAAEAAAKHAALRRLSAAFTVVPGSTVRGPGELDTPLRPAPPRRAALRAPLSELDEPGSAAPQGKWVGGAGPSYTPPPLLCGRCTTPARRSMCYGARVSRRAA